MEDHLEDDRDSLPCLMAAVLCGSVSKHGRNKLYTLHDVVTVIPPVLLPVSVHGTFYVRLSGVRENGDLRLEVLHAELPGHGGRVQLPLAWEDGVDTCEVVAELTGLAFPVSGRYEFVVLWNGRRLGSWIVDVESAHD
jgi:hypothetical protein